MENIMPSTLHFRALVLAPEIPLTGICSHFGIPPRFTWEEPLHLVGSRLQGLLAHTQGREVFLFSFGSAVFVNCAEHEIRDVIAYIEPLQPGLKISTQLFQWNDEYTLTIDSSEKPHCDTEVITITEANEDTALILATVLAKSVALERIEATLETVLDSSEKRIEALEKGKLQGADTSLAKDAGAVLRLEHESIHYLGLLDKPEITWTDEDADALYMQLARQFELRERFAGVRHRIEVLKDLGSTFANLAHAQRSARLEWIIIGLIALEVILPAVKALWQFLNTG
jgi:uncharacterized Rmd1/YagE family protein